MISSDSAQEEETIRVFEVVDSEEDFKVFNRPDLAKSPNLNPRLLPSTQVSSNQETADVPEAMVLQHKNTNLLELLESHTGGSTLEVAVHPQPVTPLTSRTSPAEALEKKWKRDKKGKEASEEGTIPPSKDPKPQKGTKVAKGSQRRNTEKILGTKIVLDRHNRVPIWNPMIELDRAPFPMDSSITNF